MVHDADPAYVTALGAVFIPLGAIFAGLRFYARHVQGNRFGPDDWLIIPAWLLVSVCGSVLIAGVQLRVYAYPIPKQAGAQNASDEHNFYFEYNEKLEWIFWECHILAMTLIKLSFVFFFRRIFVEALGNRRFNLISAIVGVIVALWGLTFILFELFDCARDFSARWSTNANHKAVCKEGNNVMLSLAITDWVTDLMILLLPISMTLRLQSEWRRKLAILSVFGVGCLSVAAGIIRFVFVNHVINLDPKTQGSGATIDRDILTTEGLYWAMLECGLALIACCMPTLHSLVQSKCMERIVQSAWKMSPLASCVSRSRTEKLDVENQGAESVPRAKSRRGGLGLSFLRSSNAKTVDTQQGTRRQSEFDDEISVLDLGHVDSGEERPSKRHLFES